VTHGARSRSRKRAQAIGIIALVVAPALGLTAARATRDRATGVPGARHPRTAGHDTTVALPFAIGEKCSYDVRYGDLKVGTGSMEVADTESVRGVDAWHTVFRVVGGIPLYHVNDLFESWFDVSTLSSLRFVQRLQEGGKDRERHFEIFPERSTYIQEGKPEKPSVSQPLDDGSFLYFARTLPLEVGKTYAFDRYFQPDRNPVTLKVLRRERVTVPAGTFMAIVVQPIIKTSGIFSENGEAQVWLADDSTRIMLQLKSKLTFGSLNLYLTSYHPGGRG
jgi:hypothetical protein